MLHADNSASGKAYPSGIDYIANMQLHSFIGLHRKPASPAAAAAPQQIAATASKISQYHFVRPFDRQIA